MNVFDDWTATVCQALGIAADEVDRDLVLDLAREVAHGVARPAAPLTTFLVGYAAGRTGGGPVAELVTKVAALAQGYGGPDGE
jgi:hypothetical protein